MSETAEITRKRFSNRKPEDLGARPGRKQEPVTVSPPNKLPKKKHPPTNGGGRSGLDGVKNKD